MTNKKKLIIPVLGTLIGVIMIAISCSKGSSGDDNNNGSNGMDTVLTDLGNNVILPSYQQFSVNAAALDSKVSAFVAAPGTSTLADVQNALKESYKSWELCSEFEFGPQADIFLDTHFTNSFPTDTAIIINNINGASYVIDGVGNFAAQGFPALDYLLFAPGTTSVLARFTTDAKATGAKQYLSALSASIKTKATALVNAWTTGDKYLTKFINATGVSSGSSLSLLVNAYVRDFDVNLQNFKLGIPIGLYGAQTLPKSPTKVEAYFSGYSAQLLVSQMKAIHDIYFGLNGKGLSHKVAATKVQKNGMLLDDVIKNQINLLTTKIQALPDPLSQGVINNSTAINDAYTEVRKLTVLLKVDMCSALGVRISFQDDDGD